MAKRSTGRHSDKTFAERLRLLSKEFGSRYALAKSSGIPSSTLQAYEGGAKPGMDALLVLARVANVDLNWLMTGKGKMRPAGLQSGAFLKDFLIVDQYELGTALAMEMVIGQIPFSRYLLESKLRLKKPSRKTLLAVEAGSNLFSIERGDLVLIDRQQATFARWHFLARSPGARAACNLSAARWEGRRDRFPTRPDSGKKRRASQ
jgi:hypothetical protein